MSSDDLEWVVMNHIWLAICELPGVWSPEDQPEAAVIEQEQLFNVIQETLQGYNAKIAKKREDVPVKVTITQQRPGVYRIGDSTKQFIDDPGRYPPTPKDEEILEELKKIRELLTALALEER